MYGKLPFSTKKICKMYKETLNRNSSARSWPYSVNEKLGPFSQRHFARLRMKYPFLPKSQIRYKVKVLWEKLNPKGTCKARMSFVNSNKRFAGKYLLLLFI